MSSVVDYSSESAAGELDAATIAGLKRLAARADELVALLDIVGAGLARGPQIADNINGLIELARGASGFKGTRIADVTSSLAQLRALVTSETFKALAGALQDSATGANLVRLLARSSELVTLIAVLNAFLARGPEIADNINGLVRLARGVQLPAPVLALFAALKDLDYVGLVTLTNTLHPILASPQVQTLLTRTDILSEGTLALVNAAAQSARDAQRTQTRTDAKAGPIGALKALNDPDVQRTVAFALDFAKRFGAKLRSGPTLPTLPPA